MEEPMAKFLEALKESEERMATRNQQALDRCLARLKDELKREIRESASTFDDWRPEIDARVSDLDATVADLRKEVEQPIGTGTSSITEEVVPPMATTTDVDPKAGVQELEAAHDNVFPELAASAASAEPLDVDATSVAAPAPTTCSTDGRGLDTEGDGSVAVSLTPWGTINSFTAFGEASLTQPGRLFVALGLDIKASCSTMCFTDDTNVFTYMFMADVTQSSTRQGQVLRPMPWPSFERRSESTYYDLLDNCGHHPLTVAVLGKALRKETGMEKWEKAISNLSTYATCAPGPVSYVNEKEVETALTIFGSFEFSLEAMPETSRRIFMVLAAISWEEPVPEACLESIGSALVQDSLFPIVVSTKVEGSLIIKLEYQSMYHRHDMVSLYLENKQMMLLILF